MFRFIEHYIFSLDSSFIIILANSHFQYNSLIVIVDTIILQQRNSYLLEES